MKPERWQEIERICNSALDLRPGERKAFVEKACAGDHALRKEVDRLLARQQEAEDFIAVPALEVAAKELARGEVTGAGPAAIPPTLRHYRIMEKIGEGGMGVVYRASDTRLNRHVAIKALPEVFATDQERLARFEREAKLLASLNHSNIGAVYGLEESDGGRRCLILELVEGETLAQRIAKGPLRVDEALEVCRQIAEGLEAAHEQGIIHRDLKPDNVKITPADKVKILDFGLAKAFQAEAATVDAERSPTITEVMTRTGVILGTAAYMSPEQAKGKAVDKRADIWAFGCVMYECLTGKRAFHRETVSETIAVILKEEPDWNLLPADTPWNVKDLLRRCLQKDPRQRLRDIGDARIEIGRSRDFVPMEAVPARKRFTLPWLVASAAIVLLAAVLIGLPLIMKYFQPAPVASVVTSTIKVEGHWLAGMRDMFEMQHPTRTAMSISSDGRFVVYSATEDTAGAKPQLFLRKMDQTAARPINGTEGGINPFLSPDNHWVGFWVNSGKLKKIPVEGGVPTTLCDAPSIFGASWGGDNSIVFADGYDKGLSRVSAEGGKPETLSKPDPKREESSHRLPSWLPNGKAVLFTAMRHDWDSQPWLALLRLDTHEWHILLRDAADARYVPTGHLVFLRQGTLMAVRFDLARLEVISQPFPLVESVMQAFSNDDSRNTAAGQYAISDTGSLIYAEGGVVPDQKNSLLWVDQRGTEQPVTPLQLPFLAPRLSPDGQKIAYVSAGRECQIWVYDLSRGTNSRLTGEGMVDSPIWTPDGKRLVFPWMKSLVLNLFWQPYDGSSPMERLTTSDHNQWPGSFSPDGKTLALVEDRPDSGDDIALLDVRSGRVTPFLNSKFNEMYPELSPDGHWIAYSSDESNRFEVYVRPFPGPGMKQQVSSEEGVEPLWARNGKQLFYRTLNQNQVWVVDVRTDGGFSTSKPRLLFEKPGYIGGGPIRAYDLSMDGQRFLMVKRDQRKPTPVTEMILVQNWFEELKRLVPTGK